MTGLQIVGVLGVAAAFGAVAGGTVAVLGSAGDATDADSALIERLDGLQARVNSLRDAVGESRDAVADVRERVVGVELELSHLAARRADPATGAALEEAAPASEAATLALGTLGQERVASDAAKVVRDALGQFKTERWANVQKRFTDAMKLRTMPEEERWQKAEEDLGLTSVQLDELKDAVADYAEARKDAITEQTITSAGGVTSSFRSVAPEKMKAAKADYDRRVNNTLNSEQKAAWNDKGYSSAFGGGGGMRFFTGRKGGDGAGGITFVSTIDTVEVETDEK